MLDTYIDISKLVPKTGNYQIATGSAVRDLTLLEIASQYETQVSRKMIALTQNKLGKRFGTTELVLQTTKVDGEGVFIYFERSKNVCFCFNAPSGLVRINFPALDALEGVLRQSTVQKGLFRAELYLQEQIHDRRATIGDVLRISFSEDAGAIDKLKLAMLDVIMLDGKDLRANQSQFEQTWNLLGELFGSDPTAPYHRPSGAIVPEDQLLRLFAEKIAAGEEGMVIRRLQRAETYKIKPRLSLDAVVIGYVAGEFEGMYGVTSLLVAMNYPKTDDSKTYWQTLVRIGSGLSDEQRLQFLNLFSAIHVENPLTMTDNDGRTIQFVKPEYIVELSGEDLLTNVPGSDRPNLTQLMAWDGSDYQFLGLYPCPRPTFATFTQLRLDKQVQNGGARLEQIINSPQLPQLQAIAPTETKILRREVYTKGTDMVRKLVVVENSGEQTIPYLVYWTDFSSKRKEPLKVSVSYALSSTRAQELAEQLITENIVRGWKSVN
ncbi:ATP-dependent DNA ligase [Aphanizomenon flos-aquae]|uniref:DNA ligase (ATP) n=1 Tax=Aphanizomenon flos-aquae FACHB-1040 TaxID=2692887 RepID=A0ABR8BUB6_APHFL|nr:ATP-dependent DNA ligase [Aphanizomenon flos-aquae]MBD2278277.1 hypothetical protein [Aphanizomenon flos-aquae FACHB-1040]